MAARKRSGGCLHRLQALKRKEDCVANHHRLDSCETQCVGNALCNCRVIQEGAVLDYDRLKHLPLRDRFGGRGVINASVDCATNARAGAVLLERAVIYLDDAVLNINRAAVCTSIIRELGLHHQHGRAFGVHSPTVLVRVAVHRCIIRKDAALDGDHCILSSNDSSCCGTAVGRQHEEPQHQAALRLHGNVLAELGPSHLIIHSRCALHDLHHPSLDGELLWVVYRRAVLLEHQADGIGKRRD
jgi:hypothetical protein